MLPLLAAGRLCDAQVLYSALELLPRLAVTAHVLFQLPHLAPVILELLLPLARFSLRAAAAFQGGLEILLGLGARPDQLFVAQRQALLLLLPVLEGAAGVVPLLGEAARLAAVRVDPLFEKL